MKVFEAVGIGHERIDGRPIAAPPVEGRARGFECGVEEISAHKCQKRGARQSVKRSRPRENQTINLLAVIDDVSLRGKGSHAVPQEEQRQVGIFFSGDLAQADHVLDEKFKAAPAKFSQLRVGREAVPAMVVGVDGETCRNERIDGVGVAPHVFAHPVGDLNNGADRAAASPASARDAQSVGAGQPEPLFRSWGRRRRYHGRCPVSVALGSHRP